MNNLDTIFYLVNPENLQLQSSAEEVICSHCAKILNSHSYGIRSGPAVQDPVSLNKEFNAIDNDKIEIIYVNREPEKVILLSNKQKKEFIEVLSALDGDDLNNNTGEICKRYFIDNCTPTAKPVYLSK
jgi:hypothetical protein